MIGPECSDKNNFLLDTIPDCISTKNYLAVIYLHIGNGCANWLYISSDDN